MDPGAHEGPSATAGARKAPRRFLSGDERVTGTYCPLCGERDLRRAVVDGIVFAYCPVRATGPSDAHTAFPIGKEEA